MKAHVHFYKTVAMAEFDVEARSIGALNKKIKRMMKKVKAAKIPVDKPTDSPFVSTYWTEQKEGE